MSSHSIQLACSTLNYAKFPFRRALEGIRRAGYDAISFGTTHESQPVPGLSDLDDRVAEIRRQVEDHGLRAISGIVAHGLKADEPCAADRYRRSLDIYRALGCTRLVGTGPWYYVKWPTEVHPPEAWERMTDTWYRMMEQVLPDAESMGMVIGIKSHTGLCAHSGLVRQTLERLGSPALQLCWDAGNVSFYEGICPDPGLAAVAGHVKVVCLKDHKGRRANPVFPPLGEGNVDHDQYFGVLAGAGFDGPMVIERLGQRESEKELSAEQIDQRAKEAMAFLSPLLAKHFGSGV
jgi:sugar phosphate isomerase/epimerase